MKSLTWLFSIAIAALGCAIALAATKTQPETAIVANSGSHNTAAWRITFSSNGSGVAFKDLPRVASQARGAALIIPLGSNPGHSFSVPAAQTSQFFHDLAAARMLGAPGSTCVKSASFGSTTVVKSHGWISPDLECPQSSAAYATLAHDVRMLEQISGVYPLHRVRLPIEPHRLPQG